MSAANGVGESASLASRNVQAVSRLVGAVSREASGDSPVNLSSREEPSSPVQESEPSVVATSQASAGARIVGRLGETRRAPRAWTRFDCFLELAQAMACSRRLKSKEVLLASLFPH